jgi:hypothetical protein
MFLKVGRSCCWWKNEHDFIFLIRKEVLVRLLEGKKRRRRMWGLKRE